MIIPKRLFDSKIMQDLKKRCTEEPDNIGFCINCGQHKQQKGESIKLKKIEQWLVLSLHGFVRTIEMNCECGSKVGLFDLDVENYRVWDISKKDNIEI